MMKPPDTTLVARFRADLEVLIGRSLGAEERLGVAVSGGPDSMALLLLAHAAYKGRVIAATVNHGLRPDAAGEAAFVAGLCSKLGVAHRILVLASDPRSSRGGVQARAREGRYRLLGEWLAEERVNLMATAHHLEDQAETLLMRLARGAGVDGLAAIRPKALLWNAAVLRPLLGWRRHELAAIAEAAGLTAIDDPSNRDPAYDRTAFRALLGREPLLDPTRLAKSAANLLGAGDAIHWAADEAMSTKLKWPDDQTIAVEVANLPPAIMRLLVSHALMTMQTRVGKFHGPIEGLDDFIANVESKGVATLAGVKCSASEDIWTFRPAPPRRTG